MRPHFRPGLRITLRRGSLLIESDSAPTVLRICWLTTSGSIRSFGVQPRMSQSGDQHIHAQPLWRLGHQPIDLFSGDRVMVHLSSQAYEAPASGRTP